MNRVRSVRNFVYGGGLLIFLSPYLIYEAAVKRLAWWVPIIVIPIYALLSYAAFKLYWRRITRR